MLIRERIRARRKELKLTQEALARRANLSLNVMNRVERGEITDPHISTLSRIAQALGVSVAEVIEEDPPRTGKAGSLLLEAGASPASLIKQWGDTFDQLAMAQEEHEKWALRSFATDPQGLKDAFDQLKRERELLDKKLEEITRERYAFLSRLAPFQALDASGQYAWISAVDELGKQEGQPLLDHARGHANSLYRAGFAAQKFLENNPSAFSDEIVDFVEQLEKEYH